MKAPDDLLEWYDNLLDSYISWDEKGCDSIETPEDAPSNRSLGRYCTQTPSLRSGMGKKAAQEVHLFVRLGRLAFQRKAGATGCF